MQRIFPFLWFDDQAQQAMNFYTNIFNNSGVGDVSSFENGGPNEDQTVFTGSFTLNGQEFMSLNGGPIFSFTPAISFFVSCQTMAEIDHLWEKLSENGTVMMEFQKYPFSEKFGWLADKFGVSWQLNLAGRDQKIAPCLMFVGDKHGKSEEAMHYYTSIFSNSQILQLERYNEQDGDTPGTVKHAKFILDGQEFAAMDSGFDHQFSFTPAISFFIKCETQEEVDYYWEKLLAGGEAEQCGWLKDKYGVSWQVVPDILSKLLSDPDEDKAGRVMKAMLKMVKLDIDQLKNA